MRKAVLVAVLSAAFACGGFPEDSKIALQRIVYVPPTLTASVLSWTNYDHCEIVVSALGKTYRVSAPDQLCIDLANSDEVKKEVQNP
jgi:hypothetical protein